MKVKFYNKDKTISRLKKAFYDEALPVVSDQMMMDCNYYVRMQSGDLAASIQKERNGRRITWNTAYARKVYYTGTPRTNVNPHASLRWCEKAIRSKKGEWVKETNKILKG